VDKIKWGLECPVCFNVVYFELDVWWDPENDDQLLVLLDFETRNLHAWLSRT
jgi:hypothetical protein